MDKTTKVFIIAACSVVIATPVAWLGLQAFRQVQISSKFTSKGKDETIAESLVGITYYGEKGNRDPNNLNPPRWVGLPAGAELTYGHLMVPGSLNFETPQKFGFQGIRIGAQSVLAFELISNFKDGKAYNRILDALETTGTAIIEPCHINEKHDPEIIAVLTANELANVNSQNPSRHDGNSAIIKSPQNVYRLNRRFLRIDKLDGSNVFCDGFPSSSH